MFSEDAWGHAFADDGVMAAASVQDWSELGDGESVRFFPQLRARAGGIAPGLRARVERCADALAAMGGAGGADDAAWLLATLSGAPDGGGRRDMARFAFLTGIHPAHLWEEAMCCLEFGTTAAWLGELSRRGRAYILPEAAEYLCDALATTGRGIEWRDKALEPLASNTKLLWTLRRAAARRMTGRRVVVRWRPAPAPRGARAIDLLHGLMRALSRGRARRFAGRSA